MNLVEHPFAVLKHQRETTGVFQLEWEQTHPRTGKKLRSRWQVRGGAEIGLPGPFEERLYLVLMEISREQNWPQRIHFARAELLARLNMARNARGFALLADGLERLKAVSIRADNAFWDAEREDYAAMVTFGMLNDAILIGEPSGRKGQTQLPLSSAEWHTVAWKSMRAGHLRSLDTEFALSLELPISLRLFRYLDKHRYGKNGLRKGFEIELHRLCVVHLGMTASPYASKLKERLIGAHSELIERGFLSGVSYRKMRTSDGEKVCYSFAPALISDEDKPETPVEGPTTPFTSLRAVLPTQSNPVDSASVLGGFLLADEEAKAQVCDAVFETLPISEQNHIKTRVKAGLAPFLQENMNTPGARGAMSRGIRKEVEVTYPKEVKSRALEESEKQSEKV